ncbi:MAG: TlyA family RNA methyltransferase [Candidatus Gastranaerophilales bacterium]|nr:TlyA family RNA methyltransferase [Candidatus Gastranaerophilales bacterium]
MAGKERLDKILVDLGLVETKSKAQSLIMSGDVLVNNEKITKPGQGFANPLELDIVVKTMPYVSRGGFKLEKALKEFAINPAGKICLDAGASTGGFTDCMLQNNAKFIYAVDVGYGQIAWKIRQNPKVKVIERTNIKNCELNDIFDNPDDEKCDFCAMDLSFISITKVLRNIRRFLKDEFAIVCLIKPQFEAGRESIGKNGVVTDKKVHLEVIKNIVQFAYENKLYPQKLTFSPIKGPKGNIEYLIYLTNNENNILDDKILEVIEKVEL